MDAAHPSSASTPVPAHAQLPDFNTIPVGGIFRAMGDSFAQDVSPAKKPTVESLEVAMLNMATMMEQQAAQMANMMQFSMNASVAAQQSTDNILRILALQMGHREAVGDPSGGVQVASQLVAAQLASSVSVTAAVEKDLTEEASAFINKMASYFEKVVKKYVQAKRNLKTAEEELEVLHDQSSMRYPSGTRPL
jgi:hypothetical protein